MAGIHISLGRESLRGPLHVIYVGESAAEAREAEAKSPLPWLVRLDNPPVVRKHNAFAEANAAKAQVLGEALFGGEPAAPAEEPAAPADETAAEAPARGRKK